MKERPTRTRFHEFLAASALGAAISLLAGCESAERAESKTFTGATMGTTYAVTVRGLDGDADDARVQACIDDALNAAQEHLSTWNSRSEISALNRNAATDWVEVSTTLAAVLAAAQRVSEETAGAFDVTVAPLVRLWGFGSGAAPSKPPSPEFVHDAMANVGHAWLELRLQPSPAVRKGKAPLEIDLDGIAPGYAVDRLGGCLARKGFANHLVEIGGEVRASGHREDGEPWRVAVEAPLPGEREAYAGIALRDQAVSTSGSYRDFRRLPDGRAISHTIDPRVGEPVRHSLVSVTVVHPRATLADAYATALLVLGPREGLAVAQRLQLPALLLERVGESGVVREHATPEFEALRVPGQQASL